MIWSVKKIDLLRLEISGHSLDSPAGAVDSVHYCSCRLQDYVAVVGAD